MMGVSKFNYCCKIPYELPLYPCLVKGNDGLTVLQELKTPIWAPRGTHKIETEVMELDYQALEVEKVTLILIHGNLMHKSGLNRSDKKQDCLFILHHRRVMLIIRKIDSYMNEAYGRRLRVSLILGITLVCFIQPKSIPMLSNCLVLKVDLPSPSLGR